ncbi:hypothetical protein Poli38472_013489 [Pythium oligandrum]|uniref:Uncharacterized protein n=1 Tax=Pythium oligandrum TaxID=41045 RepID=A0A8K1C7S0_PYTOL|nr:hypothetical protein Poli38472_013489 [Pythium oligandrum]|eukprot:TMW58015.1 hypothetical protein Poli38472_013489 [Pythium oligandrum]
MCLTTPTQLQLSEGVVHEGVIRNERDPVVDVRLAFVTRHTHQRRLVGKSCHQAGRRRYLLPAMNPTDSKSKPAAFPKPPTSALFSRLEAFLPLMETENKKLEEAIASGRGDEHNIEVPEPDATSDNADDNDEGASDDDVDMDDNSKRSDKPGKTPVIEMNFALGLMEEGGSDSDSDSDSDEEKDEIDLGATIAAAGRRQDAVETETTLKLAPAPAKRPMIVELD